MYVFSSGARNFTLLPASDVAWVEHAPLQKCTCNEDDDAAGVGSAAAAASVSMHSAAAAALYAIAQPPRKWGWARISIPVENLRFCTCCSWQHSSSSAILNSRIVCRMDR